MCTLSKNRKKSILQTEEEHSSVFGLVTSVSSSELMLISWTPQPLTLLGFILFREESPVVTYALTWMCLLLAFLLTGREFEF